MGKYFGTDGFRGEAGIELTEEHAFRIGRYLGYYLNKIEKSDKSEVCLDVDGEKINTQMKKLGAIVGDFAEIGCGSVLNPGTIVGRNTTVYPLVSVRGMRKSNCIVKSQSICINKQSTR